MQLSHIGGKSYVVGITLRASDHSWPPPPLNRGGGQLERALRSFNLDHLADVAWVYWAHHFQRELDHLYHEFAPSGGLPFAILMLAVSADVGGAWQFVKEWRGMAVR